jgi:hypothetical protein
LLLRRWPASASSTWVGSGGGQLIGYALARPDGHSRLEERENLSGTR